MTEWKATLAGLRRAVDSLRSRTREWMHACSGGTMREDREFLPAALEIIETPPSPAARGVLYCIIALVLVTLLWAALGRVDIVAIAPGRIVPTGRTKLIQPLEAGVVRAIRVENGQRVSAGDVLLEIDTTINEAEQKRIESEHRQALLDIARLKAARFADGQAAGVLIPPEGATAADVQLARALLDGQTGEMRARIATIDSQIEQSGAARAAVQATIEKLRSMTSIIRNRHDLQQSQMDRLATGRDLTDQVKEIPVQEARLAEADGAVAALEKQRRLAIAEYRRAIATELAEAQKRAASLGEQLVQATERTRLQTLRAPVDGTVEQLAVHTEGGVVTPAQVLLAVVPLDSRLEIEASVSNRDIGFIAAGQPAAIKIDTFNFTRYGLLEGRVISVSRDAIRTGAGEIASSGTETQRHSSSQQTGDTLLYQARVELPRTTMQIDGREVRLGPGMAVTVEILTGRRRLIEYLLSPLTRARQQAMRER